MCLGRYADSRDGLGLLGLGVKKTVTCVAVSAQLRSLLAQGIMMGMHGFPTPRLQFLTGVATLMLAYALSLFCDNGLIFLYSPFAFLAIVTFMRLWGVWKRN